MCWKLRNTELPKLGDRGGAEQFSPHYDGWVETRNPPDLRPPVSGRRVGGGKGRRYGNLTPVA